MAGCKPLILKDQRTLGRESSSEAEVYRSEPGIPDAERRHQNLLTATALSSYRAAPVTARPSPF